MSKKIFHIIVVLSTCFSTSAVFSANAGRVVDYDLAGGHASYTDVNTTLGETSRNTGIGFTGDLMLSNPYNSPWRTSDWVAVGAGGFITLELENYANEQAGAPELNVLVFQQMSTTGNPWYNRQAIVSVSEDASTWFQLNNGDPIQFDTPATGYVFPDSIPLAPDGSYGGVDPFSPIPYDESDYGLVMPGSIEIGPNFESTRANAYGLSGGGNWLDFSSTGLDRVGYIRFDIASDAPTYFALDAIYLNNDAVGAPVPEPTTLALLSLTSALMLRRRHRPTD